MGDISLKPEMRDEQKSLQLDGDFLEKIKNSYLKRLQVKKTVLEVLFKLI